MSDRATAGTMLGEDVAMPAALAPVGSTGMQSADGEIKAARAAERFGVPFTLSTMSVRSIKDVAQHTTKPFWFQLYAMRDEDFVDRIIERAKRASRSALVLTLDLQILGQRRKDIRNGLSTPPRLTPGTIPDRSRRWRWGLGTLGTGRRTFRNVVGHSKDVGNVAFLSAWANERFDPQLDREKVLKRKGGGKFVIKGILDPKDAKLAAGVGADAIIVSNHGGRQLDGALSSIRVLPSVERALQGCRDRPEAWLDGGIRSGQDVLKALTLGADATMIGRAWVYGLGAMGERGVMTALEVIRKELDLTMALCGRRDAATLDRDALLVPQGFEGNWRD